MGASWKPALAKPAQTSGPQPTGSDLKCVITADVLIRLLQPPI